MSENAVDVPAQPDDATPKKSRPEWLKAVIPGLIVTLIAGLFVAAFLWPMSQMEPKNISMAIAGPEEQVTQITENIAEKQEDLFEFTTLDHRDDVVQAINEREVVGGIAAGEEGIEFLTASAGNAQATQVINQVASGMKDMLAAQGAQKTTEMLGEAAQQGVPTEQLVAMLEQAQEKAGAAGVTVTDLVSGDGNIFASNLTMIPALLGGILGGVLSMVMVKRPAYRIVTILVAATGAGLLGAALLGPWFDMVPGNYGMHTLALGLGALAISSIIAGLGSLFGMGGSGLGVLLVLFVGTPWGGVIMPTEFLPEFMGSIGASMPTGTVVNLMKSISYFSEAATAAQWWTLTLWALVGFTLILIGAALKRNKVLPADGDAVRSDAVTA